MPWRMFTVLCVILASEDSAVVETVYSTVRNTSQGGMEIVCCSGAGCRCRRHPPELHCKQTMAFLDRVRVHGEVCMQPG